VELDNQNISTVTIYGTPTPVHNIPVNFTISTYPAGAEGFSLSKSSETTNIQGIADVQLKLGNIPAEYGVTATCPDCVPEQNSVTFSCCGKLHTDEFRQFDERWKSEHYDNICSTEPPGTGRYRPVYSCDDAIFNKPEYRNKKYQFTIWGKGCALSALATLINYYKEKYNLQISSTTPKDLNNWLSENYVIENHKKIACYSDKGDVEFSCVSKYSNGKIKKSKIIDIDILSIPRDKLLKIIDDEIIKQKPVIIKISNFKHYVLVIGKCKDKYLTSDPAGKIILYDPNPNKSELKSYRTFYKNY
jgi:hypothetical protein